MKDYYKILGVEEDASEEEIRSRWIELTKQYHPDLKGGTIDDEKIKEINEAYEILRDLSKRMDYDFKRALKRSLVKRIKEREAKRTHHLKRNLLSIGLIILIFIFGILFYQLFFFHKTTLETTSVVKNVEERVSQSIYSKKEDKVSNVHEEKKFLNEPEIKKRPFTIEISKREEFILQEKSFKEQQPLPVEEDRISSNKKSKEIIKSDVFLKTPKEEIDVKSLDEIPIESPKPEFREVSKESVQEPSRVAVKSGIEEMVKDVPKEMTKRDFLKEPVKEIKKDSIKDLPEKSIKDDHKEFVKEVPKELPKSTEFSKEIPKTISLKKAEEIPKTPLLTSALIKEEEVKMFLRDYINKYVQKDIQGFLSLFSKRAIQNHKHGFDEIRKIYTKFFDQSKGLHYEIKETKIEINPEYVQVKARYRVDQSLKRDEGEKVWRGTIQWILKKEEGRLKIFEIDYQHER